MDFQKEKIAHEKHLLSQGVDFKYLPNIQYSELENVYELIEWDEEYSEALNEINSSWCTWQAAKAQAVPDGFVVVNKKELAKVLNCVTDNWLIDTDSVEEFKKIESLVQDEIDEMFKAWEPAMTENTIRCTNCGLEFESDYDLEQNLIDPETGEIHDGCPTCKTDAYLMDLIKYPDLEPAND